MGLFNSTAAKIKDVRILYPSVHCQLVKTIFIFTIYKKNLSYGIEYTITFGYIVENMEGYTLF